MPITIGTPPSGGPLGPGFAVQLSTDAVGPWPTSTFWDVQIYPTAQPEYSIARGKVTQQLNTAVVVVGQDDGEPALVNAMIAGGEHGKPALLVARHMQDETTVLEQVSQPVVIDMQSGLAFQTQRVATTGSFTEPDRVVLMQAQGGILSLLVDVFLEPVVEWLAQYAPQSFQPIPYDALVCDETILVRPTLAPFVRWTGVRWKLVQWPSGLGIVDGFPDHTYASWGQISLTKLNDDGAAIAYDTRYLAVNEGEILWGTNEPYNVQVYVLPGVCAEFQALSAPPWSPTRR